MEGSISTKSDVYSYGIMLMEVFTGIKPSNDMFGGILSLREWVKNSMPNSLVEVVDSKILLVRPPPPPPHHHHYPATEAEAEATDEEINWKEERLKCVSSIMEVALNCTMESVKERINISDALAALDKIKLQLSICV